MATKAQVRVGIGGWAFAPWRNNFYPAGLAQTKELGFASRALTAIEINSTFYGAQKPATFARWRDDTPEGFVFSVKASRHATHRSVLAEAGESIQRFVGSGIAELGAKLGPIVWQFMATKAFEPVDFGAFLALLPAKVEGLPLRHVVDARHPSFMCAEYLALARRHRVTTVFTDSDTHPSFADATGDHIYARLMKAESEQPQGYAPAELDRWAGRAQSWCAGSHPADLPRVDASAALDQFKPKPRDVFIFFINGAKERAPAAAQGLLARL